MVDNHLRTERVLDAMETAVGQRRPGDGICHRDQGSQSTSLAFGKRCGEAGVRPSMGPVCDTHDNAMVETFFPTLEAELLSRRSFTSQAEARKAGGSYIDGWYSPVRLHSGLGHRSPMTCEADWEAALIKPEPISRPLKRGNLNPTFWSSRRKGSSFCRFPIIGATAPTRGGSHAEPDRK